MPYIGAYSVLSLCTNVLSLLIEFILYYIVCSRRAQEMLLALKDPESKLAQAIAYGAKILKLGRCLDISLAHI